MPTRFPLAPKPIARVFYLNSRHVMVIKGSKPCKGEVRLFPRQLVAEASGLTLRIADQDRDTHCSDSDELDTYYLVQPILPGIPKRSWVVLEHEAGIQRIPVESIGCHFLRATGVSQAFDFDEAFTDALRRLPIFQQTDPGLPLPLVDVVAVGALYGGFAGFSHLFMRVEPVLAPSRESLGMLPLRSS
jgi:hypothetical protein